MSPIIPAIAASPSNINSYCGTRYRCPSHASAATTTATPTVNRPFSPVFANRTSAATTTASITARIPISGPPTAGTCP